MRRFLNQVVGDFAQKDSSHFLAASLGQLDNGSLDCLLRSFSGSYSGSSSTSGPPRQKTHSQKQRPSRSGRTPFSVSDYEPDAAVTTPFSSYTPPIVRPGFADPKNVASKFASPDVPAEGSLPPPELLAYLQSRAQHLTPRALAGFVTAIAQNLTQLGQKEISGHRDLDKAFSVIVEHGLRPPSIHGDGELDPYLLSTLADVSNKFKSQHVARIFSAIHRSLPRHDPASLHEATIASILRSATRRPDLLRDDLFQLLVTAFQNRISEHTRVDQASDALFSIACLQGMDARFTPPARLLKAVARVIVAKISLARVRDIAKALRAIVQLGGQDDLSDQDVEVLFAPLKTAELASRDETTLGCLMLASVAFGPTSSSADALMHNVARIILNRLAESSGAALDDGELTTALLWSYRHLQIPLPKETQEDIFAMLSASLPRLAPSVVALAFHSLVTMKAELPEDLRERFYRYLETRSPSMDGSQAFRMLQTVSAVDNFVIRSLPKYTHFKMLLPEGPLNALQRALEPPADAAAAVPTDWAADVLYDLARLQYPPTNKGLIAAIKSTLASSVSPSYASIKAIYSFGHLAIHPGNEVLMPLLKGVTAACSRLGFHEVCFGMHALALLGSVFPQVTMPTAEGKKSAANAAVHAAFCDTAAALTARLSTVGPAVLSSSAGAEALPTKLQNSCNMAFYAAELHTSTWKGAQEHLALPTSVREAGRRGHTGDIKAHHAAGRASEFQEELAASIQRMRLPFELECMTDDGLMIVDVHVDLPSGVQLAIEANGPKHYTREREGWRPLGRTIARRRILEARYGYRVLEIPVWTWYEAGRQGRKVMVEDLLKEEGLV